MRRIVLPLHAFTLFVSALAASGETAAVFLRWNEAGYRPDQPRTLVAMSETDLTGLRWRIERQVPEGGDSPAAGAAADEAASGKIVMSGVFAASVVGAGDHTPLPFNHVVDFSALTEPGRYRFVGPGGTSAELRIEAAPYRRFIPEALRHLRVMRSGSHETLLRAFSHPGDARAPVWVPDGDVAEGRWRPASPARTVDVQGGWYDAGDQIKFTLNIAYTTCHLLLAWDLAPDLFDVVYSRSGLPDVLDEARHGLAFLMRVFPDEDTFVIQVGDERDHDQPPRLPEHDPLDGRRPALCALSRVHMGSAAAALALGAQTWRRLGREEEAAGFEAKARAIFERALGPDTVVTAFERGEVNDFYRDTTDADQMALAAVALYRMSGDERFLAHARRLAPPPAPEVSWGSWNWLPNALMAPRDAEARARLLAEVDAYARHALANGRPWGIPGAYVWGSLHRWIGAANAAEFANRVAGTDSARRTLFFSMLDYTFGRNNWGVSFMFSEQLPNSVRHIYSPTYHLLGVFPTGALSEGPGNRSTHDALRRYFGPERPDDPLARFNTPAAVFNDNAKDFMCQESTIGGQADLVLMLTLAATAGQ